MHIGCAKVARDLTRSAAVMKSSRTCLISKLRGAYERLLDRDKERLGSKEICAVRVAEETMGRSVCCLPLMWASLCVGARQVEPQARAAALRGSNGAALLRLILGRSRSLSHLCVMCVYVGCPG